MEKIREHEMDVGIILGFIGNRVSQNSGSQEMDYGMLGSILGVPRFKEISFCLRPACPPRPAARRLRVGAAVVSPRTGRGWAGFRVQGSPTNIRTLHPS